MATSGLAPFPPEVAFLTNDQKVTCLISSACRESFGVGAVGVRTPFMADSTLTYALRVDSSQGKIGLKEIQSEKGSEKRG